MQRLHISQFLCRECFKRLGSSSRRFLEALDNESFTSVRRRAFSHASRRSNQATGSTKRPFRLAIIGSGPAGFYSAYRLMQKVDDAIVDMYEKLPAPFGLVRYGVAPDHPEVKNCQEKFEQVASSARFNYIGNIAVGTDLPLTVLRSHYDAILFAYGASEDRRLNIPGEDLKGVYSARAFVAWYNGLPEYSDLNPILDRGEDAIVIGQGNVALDVARILLSNVDDLRHTDITDHALEALSKSKIRRVQVVGRRGPMQAAFTLKEVRELMNLPNVSFKPIDSGLLPSDVSKLTRTPKRRVQLLSKGSPNDLATADRSWALRFLLSPVSIQSSSSDIEVVDSVSFRKTEFQDSNHDVADARVRQTDEIVSLPGSTVFKSVGYKSEPLQGLEEIGVPFDEKLGIIPNDIHGRVISPNIGPGSHTAGHIPGLYCVGWVKRGPTGVIASTMDDAFTTADVIAKDWEDKVPFLASEEDGGKSMGWDGLKQIIRKSSLRAINWRDWQRIDQLEKQKGKVVGKEREKFTSVSAMLNALDS
ncbi:MAG: NADPH-adrenodoxin reductase [Bogoriella megaspora]|nr:MAG: NADPH-adrenodoxin reductase [Bogoriella megaspora]